LSSRGVDRAAALAAVATLVVAWLAGAALSQQDVTPFLHAAWPEAERFDPLDGDTVAAFSGDALLGYVTELIALGAILGCVALVLLEIADRVRADTALRRVGQGRGPGVEVMSAFSRPGTGRGR
jgi:hypothetical protein